MDEGKVSKARMQLVTSRCQRIRAPKLKHAVWQNGGVVLLSHPSRTQPQRIQTPRGRRYKSERSTVCSSWLFTRSSIQVQAWPVHQIRPNRGVGLRRLCPWPRKNSRPKPLSTKPIAQLEAQADPPLPFRRSLASQPTADSHTASSIQPSAPHRRSKSHLLPIADSALASQFHFLLFFWGPPLYEADRHSGSVTPSADQPLPFRRSLASKPTGSSIQFHFLLSATPSQSAGRGLVWRREGRRRTSRYTTTVRTLNMPHTPPDTHVTSIYRTTWLNMHLMGDLG